jgi:hypothetical protein
MFATLLRSPLQRTAVVAALLLPTGAQAQTRDGEVAHASGRDIDPAQRGQHTSGVIARVGIEQLPVGCISAGKATGPAAWANAAGDAKCSIASQQDNVDGLMIIVRWSTLQPGEFDDPLRSYYIDNAIYSLAHPERQSIHLAVLAGTNSPNWLMSGPGRAFQDKFGAGTCDPTGSGRPPSIGAPGKIWSAFSFKGKSEPMPNPFGSNSCLFTALDNLVEKLGQTGAYDRPSTPLYPKPLAPYDDLYYDAAPDRPGFVHTTRPTATMNKIVGHVSALGPHSYDAESVLCETERDCDSAGPNYKLWTSLQPDDSAMEAAIEDAQKKAIDIYAKYFPSTYWTVDLVQRQMPFFSPTGCKVTVGLYRPTAPGPGGHANDASDCLGKLRTNLISYIQASYPQHGGIQNNSLSPKSGELASHPVWQQTALAAQAPPFNPVKLFAGLQVTAPQTFYPPGEKTFQQLQGSDQMAVNLAKHMVEGYSGVDFIEFYDVEIANNFSVPTVKGQCTERSHYVNSPPSAINDAANGLTFGGFMHVPLTDAHRSLRGEPPLSASPSLMASSVETKCLRAGNRVPPPPPPVVPKCAPGARCQPPT